MADIVIVGAGNVGLVLALTLAQNTSLSIELIEAKPFPDKSNGRVVNITPRSMEMFKTFGIWSAIENSFPGTFQHITIWDDQDTRLNFAARGSIIENHVIQQALLEKLKNYPAVKMNIPATIDVIPDNAKLIVGADGANSKLRKLAHIPIVSWDYAHHALVANIKTELPHQNIARQWFLRKGPLAFLPLHDPHTCSIVWSYPSDVIEELKALPQQLFEERITMAAKNTLGKVILLSELQIFPLRMQHATHYVQERIALIGDAAHTFHPLAGQGINLGFADAMALAKTIQETLQQKRNIGALRNLRRYERERKGDNIAMIAAMETLYYVFTDRPLPVRLLRSFGLRLLDTFQKVMDFSYA